MEEITFSLKIEATTKAVEFVEKCVAVWANTEDADMSLIKELFVVGLKKVVKLNGEEISEEE